MLNFDQINYPKRVTSPFNKENFINLFKCLIVALHNAHKKNISHNDLKPDNVFVHEDDERNLIFFIGDWGGSTFVIG